MIKYRLRCESGHEFDGWYASSAGFERLRDGGHVSCVTCGSVAVDRALMAPAVAPGRAGAEAPTAPPPAPTAAAEPPADLAQLRAAIERDSDYVGMRFAREARAMHEGTAPSRAIHGEARPEEARALLEDGVPVLPLPFIPKQKQN